jgi:hypothetical protein
MAFVEIPLNSFRYRFRLLPWTEEFEIPFPAGEDQRKILLAHALVDISGLPITSVADASQVLTQLPPAIFWRILMVSGKLTRRSVFHNQGALRRSGPEDVQQTAPCNGAGSGGDY